MADAAYWIEVGWNLALVLFLVFLNGFFVATEFAIVKVRETQFLDVKGTRKAAAVHVVNHLDAYLSACQLGITIASLALGWIGEPAVAHLIVEPLVGRFGFAPSTISAISFVIAFLIITALHIIVGELAPKTLAIRRAKGTALFVALPIRAFRKLFAPFIWVLNGAANLLLKMFGVKPLARTEDDHSIAELQLLLSRVAPKERTERRSAEVASRVFALSNRNVRDIMVPRDRMVCLDIQRPFAENLKIVEENPFTRYPLADGGPDSILGFVHQRDVFAAAKSNPPRALEQLIRDVWVFPTSQVVSRALFELLEKRKPMAIIVNEFGVTVGLLTLEDIFEELVGDIPSEFERSDPRLRVLGPGQYLVDASIPLHELQVVLREPLPESHASTLAGLLNERFGRIPAQGEKKAIGPYSYWIKEADRQRARLVEIRHVDGAQASASGTVPPPAP